MSLNMANVEVDGKLIDLQYSKKEDLEKASKRISELKAKKKDEIDSYLEEMGEDIE